MLHLTRQDERMIEIDAITFAALATRSDVLDEYQMWEVDLLEGRVEWYGSELAMSRLRHFASAARARRIELRDARGF
ncbi:hypothetical protein LGT39_02790 [Demequina sp. TTPB684]|uniref:hypothetical protein n=1 Tax=unclassified Demequina TaxID=2620311 RepID=UPI001CF11CAD|nr:MULTISPECIES: hypothetical protein [unclassified Demequina]MCB2411775.1 hypothetical protein [Demequina sp. TTPB684]UPU89004.1 hypothetical protein LGT36_003520 [Demequina sp. TMPB413]